MKTSIPQYQLTKQTILAIFGRKEMKDTTD
jgi:hypothetical protein